jgi:hypothetical protein
MRGESDGMIIHVGPFSEAIPSSLMLRPPLQTVPEDPLLQCQRLPTLCAIQHFEKQSCGEAAE